MSVFNHTYGSDTDRRVVSERFFFFFSSRRFCQCIVKTGQRTHTHKRIKRRRTCSSSSFFFFFYHLYRWLLVDFNKTIDISTQLRRLQLSRSVYRLMATFCSRWLKAVVNNNEELWLRHTNRSSSSSESDALNIRLAIAQFAHDYASSSSLLLSLSSYWRKKHMFYFLR